MLINDSNEEHLFKVGTNLVPPKRVEPTFQNRVYPGEVVLMTYANLVAVSWPSVFEG